jgi:hypothetical protein
VSGGRQEKDPQQEQKPTLSPVRSGGLLGEAAARG